MRFKLWDHEPDADEYEDLLSFLNILNNVNILGIFWDLLIIFDIIERKTIEIQSSNLI